MFVCFWICFPDKDNEYLTDFIDDEAIWGPRKNAKKFASMKEAEEYLHYPNGPHIGMRYWSTTSVIVVYIHPLNCQ